MKVKVAQSRLTLCDSVEFSRPEYWSGELFPSPADLPDLGIEPESPALQADSLPAELPGKPKRLKAELKYMPGDSKLVLFSMGAF